MCRSRGRSSRPIIATEPPPAAQCGAAKPSLAFAAPSVAGNRRLPLTDASPSWRRVASMALIRSPGWRPGGAGGARVRRRRPRRRRRRDIRQPSLAFAAPSVAGNRRLPLTDASPSRRRVASMALIRSPGWRPGGAGGARVRRRRPRRRRRRDIRQPSLAFAAPVGRGQPPVASDRRVALPATRGEHGASALSMPTALRHPGCDCRHTPALRAWATPP